MGTESFLGKNHAHIKAFQVKEVGPSFSKENQLTDLVGVTFPVSL
jgi:hypothetical protein